MNFDLSEEQNILKDSVARFVADHYELETRRGYVAQEQGFSAENWAQFAELGWLSVPFAEEHGGFGGGAADLMVVMEELGKGLAVEPYLATVVLFGGALQAGGNDAQKAMIESIIDGSLHGALAFHERNSRYELSSVCTTASSNSDGFALNGEKTVVMNGGAANKFIVSARTSGNTNDADGISLFLVDRDASGVELNTYSLMDGQRVSNVSLSNVQLSDDALVGEEGKGMAILEAVQAQALVALAAEAQGAMQVLVDSTVEYSKTRKQFGVSISTFQVLQHRMVDMFVACEQARSMMLRTVCSIDEDATNRDEADIARNLHALKVMVGRSGKYIGDEAIQIHGGMGMTDELAVGHYVKRLMTINRTLGDADYHLAKFADLSDA